jgi:two-component system, response regulator YesN
MKILIVEDEMYILNGILSVIKKNIDFPCKLVGMLDSGEALKKAQSIHPDLIITDIVMPNMSGLEFIEKVKTQKLCSNFIVISAHEDFSFAQKAIKFRVVDYLLKPIDKVRLIENIEYIYSQIPYKYTGMQNRVMPDIPFLSIKYEDHTYPASLKKILEYIKCNYVKDISLSEISERFSLNTSYVSTLFTKHLGEGFVYYINYVRIKKAVELLIYEESMSVPEIAYAVGYSSERRLYRAFNTFMNITPGDIRKMYYPISDPTTQ